MNTADRRAYAREWARRRRARAFAERLRGAVTCPRKEGRHGVCGGRLEIVVGELGRTVVVCPRCERRARGICRDCPAPVAGTIGKSLRCAACRKRLVAACGRRYKAEHAREIRARERSRARGQRGDRAAYKRLWRLANPERVREQKRREALRGHPLRRQAAKRAQGHRNPPPRYAPGTRPCLTPGCEHTVTGLAKKCAPCKQAARELATARLRASRERAA